MLKLLSKERVKDPKELENIMIYYKINKENSHKYTNKLCVDRIQTNSEISEEASSG